MINGRLTYSDIVRLIHIVWSSKHSDKYKKDLTIGLVGLKEQVIE